MSALKKTSVRRVRDRRRAASVLQMIVDGSDVYECYRKLYSLWCSNNAALPGLRVLFRIPGVDPDGFLSVTDSFRARIRSLAAEILPLISER